MKKLLLAGVALVAVHAQAAEHVTGPPTTLGTGFTYTTGVIHASNVIGKSADYTDPTILKGKTYSATLTLANVTGSGMLTVGVGGPKVSVTLGNHAGGCGLEGECPITSNFNNSLGLIANNSVHTPDDSADPVGAFRFVARVVKVGDFDPMVFPCAPGAAHLHMFFGNTGINPCSTYKSIRTTGGSGNGIERYPVNRTSEWEPVLKDKSGHILIPYFGNFYYKRVPKTNPFCGFPDATHGGICVGTPNGLHYIAGGGAPGRGVLSSNPLEQASTNFQCQSPTVQDLSDPTATGTYSTIPAMVAAGCPNGATIHVTISAPQCWDGVNIDSADHRSHMAYEKTSDGTVNVSFTQYGVAQPPQPFYKCPVDHPYRIPVHSAQNYYHTNPLTPMADLHFSSDEMVSPQAPGGTSLHLDYFEGWDTAIKRLWEAQCIDAHITCAQGELGDPALPGRRIPTAGYGDSKNSGQTTFPQSHVGLSHPLMGNGTFVVEITAASSGRFSLSSYDGFTGDITAFSLVDVTKSNTGTPITVHTH